MRTFRAFLAFGLLSGVLIALAPAASAAGCMDIQSVQFDSPGDDNFSTESLNAEYVKIKNACNTDKNLKKMTLGDEDAIKFTFPKFTLESGKSVKVHTGSGNKNARHLYMGELNYVWNNGTDTAFFRSKGGKLVSRCAWDSSDPGAKVIC
jgi:hypothetical protein